MPRGKPKLTETFADRHANGNGLHIAPAIPMVPMPPPHVLIPQPVLAQASQSAVPPIAPVAEPLPLKVALIGTAPSSRSLAPFNDPTWQIWACSPGNMNVLPRADAWFEIHGNLLWPECESYGKPYIEWLKRLTIPVYMQDQGYVPQALSFPKDEMVKEFGRDFFTSSFAWMMALAITKGAKEIALYGIDMASKDEYFQQRSGFYFFKHIAEQRGVKVWAPHESDIMQPPGLYGFSEVTPFGRKIHAREKEINDRLAGMKNELARLQQNITYLEGASEDVTYWKQIWCGAQSHPTGGDE